MAPVQGHFSRKAGSPIAWGVSRTNAGWSCKTGGVQACVKWHPVRERQIYRQVGAQDQLIFEVVVDKTEYLSYKLSIVGWFS